MWQGLQVRGIKDPGFACLTRVGAEGAIDSKAGPCSRQGCMAMSQLAARALLSLSISWSEGGGHGTSGRAHGITSFSRTHKERLPTEYSQYIEYSQCSQ